MINISDLPAPIPKFATGLWRRRWIVLSVAWMVALLGWLLVWLLPDQYESRAQVFVQTETILDPVMSGVTARPDYEKRVEVMTLQLLTRPNVERIIVRSGLDKEIEAASETERRAKLEKLIDFVAESVAIASPQELYFIISYRYGDPVIARNVVDAVLNLLIEQDLGASLTENEEAKRRLDSQIEEFDRRLTDKEQEVADFRRLNAEELSVVQGNARQREIRERELARIESELTLARRQVATLENTIATTPRTSSGKELDELLVELAQLRSQYQENYPDIVNLKARIAELQAGAQNVLPDNPEFRRLQAELRSARDLAGSLRDRRERLLAELETLSFTIGQAPAVEAELQRIVRDYEQTRKGYEELIERRDRLSLTANLGAGGQGVEYKIFERPTASMAPVAPPRFLLILGALLAALGAGAAAGLGLTLLDKTFTQTVELETAFGLPVLGSISEASSDVVRRARGADYRRLALGALGLFLVGALYAYWEVFRLPANVTTGAQNAILEQAAPPPLRDAS